MPGILCTALIKPYSSCFVLFLLNLTCRNHFPVIAIVSPRHWKYLTRSITFLPYVNLIILSREFLSYWHFRPVWKALVPEITDNDTYVDGKPHFNFNLILYQTIGCFLSSLHILFSAHGEIPLNRTSFWPINKLFRISKAKKKTLVSFIFVFKMKRIKTSSTFQMPERFLLNNYIQAHIIFLLDSEPPWSFTAIFLCFSSISIIHYLVNRIQISLIKFVTLTNTSLQHSKK